MGAGTSREDLEAAIREQDARAQVSIGLLSYVNHLTFPTWALPKYALWMRQDAKYAMANELLGMVECHLQGRPLFASHLQSGSTSEGMSLPTTITMQDNKCVYMETADVDTLSIDMEHMVATSAAQAWALGTNLVLDTSHTHDAFAQIRVLYYTGKVTPDLCESRDRNHIKQVYLSRGLPKTLLGHLREQRGQTTNGPAVTDEMFGTVNLQADAPAVAEGSTDYVYAIRCSGWPAGMKAWAERPRKEGWPSKDTIQTVLQMSCYLVPVAHKLSVDPEIEWRLSFSAAELIIADTFTLHKRQVYLLFKYLVKQAISGLGTGMCTYHLKTTFSWANEQIPADHWEPGRMGAAFLKVLDVLSRFIEDHHIPNYFFPESNLIAHLTKDQLALASSAVQRIREQPLQSLLDTQERIRFPGQPQYHSFNSLFGTQLQQINQGIMSGQGFKTGDWLGLAVSHTSALLSQGFVQDTVSAADWQRQVAQRLLPTDLTASQVWYVMYHYILWTCREVDQAVECIDSAISQCEKLLSGTASAMNHEAQAPEQGSDNCGQNNTCQLPSEEHTLNEVTSMLTALLGQLYNIKMHNSTGKPRQICETRARALLEEAKRLYPSVMCDSEFTVFYRRHKLHLSPFDTASERAKAFLASSPPANSTDKSHNMKQGGSSNPDSTECQSSDVINANPIDIEALNFDYVGQDTMLDMLEKTTYWLETLPMMVKVNDEVTRGNEFSALWKSFLILEAPILEAPLRSLVKETQGQTRVSIPYEIYMMYSVAVRFQGTSAPANDPMEISLEQFRDQACGMASNLLGIYCEMLSLQCEHRPELIKAEDPQLCLSAVFVMRGIVAWQEKLYEEARQHWQKAHALKPDLDTLRRSLELQDGDDLELISRKPENLICEQTVTKKEEPASQSDSHSVECSPYHAIHSANTGGAVMESDATKGNPSQDNHPAGETLNEIDQASEGTTSAQNNTLGQQSESVFADDPQQESDTVPPSQEGLSPQDSQPHRNPRPKPVKSKILNALLWPVLLPVMGVLKLTEGVLRVALLAAPYIAPVLYTMQTGMVRLKGSVLGRYDIIPPEEVKGLEWINGTYKPHTPEDSIPTKKDIDEFAAILQARGVSTAGIWPADELQAARERLRIGAPTDDLAHLREILEPVKFLDAEIVGVHTKIDSQSSAVIIDGQVYYPTKLPKEINLENVLKYRRLKEMMKTHFDVRKIHIEITS